MTDERKSRWVSYSMLNQHRKCPQAWSYSRIRKLEKLTDADEPVVRDMGTWWHALLGADAVERGTKLNSIKMVPAFLRIPGSLQVDDEFKPSTIASTRGVGYVVTMAERWWAKQQEETRQQYIEMLGEPVPQRLDGLFAAWSERWAEERETEAPLAVELQWTRALPEVPEEVPGDNDRQFMLSGQLDEVLLDRRRNIVVVRDWKSSGDALKGNTAVDDMMDSQLQFYAWGGTPLILPWGLGQVRAAAYDRVATPKPKVPQLTASGQLSKSVSNYDLRTYREWAKGPDGNGVPWGEPGEYFKSGPRKDQPKFGLYTADPEVEAMLATDTWQSRWFMRTGPTPLSPNVVRSHLLAAIDTARASERTRRRVEKTGEAPRNLGPQCRWCDFVALCRAEMIGGPNGDYDLEDFRLRRRDGEGRSSDPGSGPRLAETAS